MDFKPVFIEATTIDDCWFQILQAIYEKGRVYTKTSGSSTGMPIYGLDFLSGFIHYPHTRPLTPIMPEGVPPVTTDENIEQYFVSYLMSSQLEKNEHYKYSTWIVGGQGKNERVSCNVNQVEWIIEHFKNHGLRNNHCCLMVGNPDTALEYDKEYMECPNCHTFHKRQIKLCPVCNVKLITNEAKRPTSPCLRLLDFRVIDGYLTTNVVYRGWNSMAFPENIGGFTLLNEYISDQLNVEPGPISFSTKAMNCPEEVFEILKLRLRK